MTEFASERQLTVGSQAVSKMHQITEWADYPAIRVVVLSLSQDYSFKLLPPAVH